METEKDDVFEWTIENLSHWCAEVHGHCIQSPQFHYPWSKMDLYPKGIDGQGEHLVVRLYNTLIPFSGELSFYSSDGSLLCSKQQVNVEKDVLEFTPGPKFEDVLSRIRNSKDFIVVKLRLPDGHYCVNGVCTTVNVFKISVKMNPRWVETIKSVSINNTKKFCYIQFSPDHYSNGMELITCLENDIVYFMINPPYDITNSMIDPPAKYKYPFAVEMCMSLTGSDDNAVNCLKNEHVFRDNSPWTFPYPLQKKELVGKEISLFLWVKTKNVIQSSFYVNYDYSNISVQLNNTSCFSEKTPSTAPVTPDKVAVLTKDSGSLPHF